MSEQERPPRGIMPYDLWIADPPTKLGDVIDRAYDLWLENRLTELSAAINRATEARRYTHVYKWILELTHIMELRFPDVKNK